MPRQVKVWKTEQGAPVYTKDFRSVFRSSLPRKDLRSLRKTASTKGEPGMKMTVWLLPLLLLGCGHVSKADYIRQHGCKTHMSMLPDDKYYYDGKVHVVPGSQVWLCPGGVSVVVFSNEERP
jgi:hypothetical protein